MKTIIGSAVIALSALTGSVSQAAVLLPNLYAQEYCSFRQMGASVEDSMSAAVEASMISGEPVKVEINGRMVDADVIRANMAARERCPQYFN